ncbi:2'-5' RNA ligase family protein [Nocardioides sp. SR21]|uniref:2'-5' RNA ligase family protein n=1 Tax=Nocardioides sp. SR21 TaxID=2919501 RepID=UPI001FAA3A2E|nr:2'-5' RNA ligase family protein [Nocardioides sp. SR21]
MPEPRPHSGLIVEVPESEAAVSHHRDALDVNARGGVPAHFTVLFPFLPPDRIDGAVLEHLTALFGAVPAFDIALTRTAWFDRHVLWLAPEDPAPFRALTALVHAAYPEFPPFAGLYADVVPHLTVGHGEQLEEMELAELYVKQHLPIRSTARAVTLMTQAAPDGPWTTAARFPLATGDETAGAAGEARATVAL